MSAQPTGAMPVPFHGARGGSHPLTWGQKDLHRALRRYSRTFIQRIALPIPPGLGLAEIGDSLRWAIERYEALRTLYPSRPGQPPRQWVRQEGTLTVRLLCAAPDDCRPDMELPGFGRAFDDSAELPIRCAVVADQDGPRWLVLELSRLCADLGARRVLERALAVRLSGKAHWHAEPAHQPADRAYAESMPASRAASAEAAAYIARLLDTHPEKVFAVTSVPGDSAVRSWPRARMSSPALGRAVGVLSQRHQVSAASVYLAYMSLMIAALSGSSGFIVKAVSSNRWIPGGRDYLGTLNQYVPVAVDLADADFSSVLRRTQSASLRGFSHGLYDIADLEAAGRGAALDRVDCIINMSQSRGRKVPSGQRPISELMDATTVTDLAPVTDFPDEIRRSLHLLVGGTSERPEVTLMVNRGVLPTARLDAMLRDLEELAVRDAECPNVKAAVG